jgi:hypothetical protein
VERGAIEQGLQRRGIVYIWSESKHSKRSCLHHVYGDLKIHVWTEVAFEDIHCASTPSYRQSNRERNGRGFNGPATDFSENSIYLCWTFPNAKSRGLESASIYTRT